LALITSNIVRCLYEGSQTSNTWGDKVKEKQMADRRDTEGKTIRGRMAEEELVQEKTDSQGRRWREEEEELEKEIAGLKAQLKDREDSLPAHSVRPQQMLVIEELETVIEDKEKELNKLRKRSRDPK